MEYQIRLPGVDNRVKQITSLPLAKLAHSRFNPRRTRPEPEIVNLAERIGRNGYEITRAVWAHPVNEHYEVFAGGTRLEAAKRANLSEIPVVLHEGFTDEELCRLADLDNENDEYHRPVPIVDVWLSYKALADAGWTQPRIAAAKGCSQALVSYRVQLANLPDQVLTRFINSPELTERVALEIAKLSTVDNLSPWLTREQAMIEIIDKVTVLTAPDFAKKVAEYNGFIKAAQDFADSLDHRYRSLFIDWLLAKAVRTKAGVKDVAAKITYAITEEKRRKEEEARIALEESQRATVEAERRERAARERDEWFAKNVRLINTKMQDLSVDEIRPDSVHMIFTDPPYDESSIPLYGELAKFAARVLRTGGHLITYAPHYALPEVFPLMCRYKDLRFWWTLALDHDGGNARLPGKWVFVHWKPLLWFVKDQRNDHEYVADMVKSKTPDKEQHPWQQDTTEAAYYIEHLTQPGDTVLDPFVGSGTTLLAAITLGRKVIGIDVKPECLETTKERLDAYYTGVGMPQSTGG